MGRNPKIRSSFINDAQFMLRLRKAIELDDELPGAWKMVVIDKLTQLATILMNSPTKEPAKEAAAIVVDK